MPESLSCIWSHYIPSESLSESLGSSGSGLCFGLLDNSVSEGNQTLGVTSFLERSLMSEEKAISFQQTQFTSRITLHQKSLPFLLVLDDLLTLVFVCVPGPCGWRGETFHDINTNWVITLLYMALGLCDLEKISNCKFFDRYCDCDLICDFKFAKSRFSSILSIMCSTVWVLLPCKKKNKPIETVTEILIIYMKNHYKIPFCLGHYSNRNYCCSIDCHLLDYIPPIECIKYQ